MSQVGADHISNHDKQSWTSKNVPQKWRPEVKMLNDAQRDRNHRQVYTQTQILMF